jgi:signal peptidase I
MNLNFELILFYATLVCGVIALVDRIFWAPKRNRAYAQVNQNVENPQPLKLPMIVDYAYSFFPVLLLVFLLRSFLYEPFRIPSGSLEPTLFPGDFILVNKYDYGIRLPVIHKTIYKMNEPKRGDIVVFRWPPNPSVDFIKRLIGVPGDRISYIDKVLYVNDQKVPQEFIKNTTNIDDSGTELDVELKEENFYGVKHEIFQIPNQTSYDFHDVVVPEGMYFMMGDNRDASADSRFWGFVPNENIVGRATMVWMSWDPFADKVRWSRIGGRIH